MRFWASWVLGPAAGPKGVSSFSVPKMGRVLRLAFQIWLTPKIVPYVSYSWQTWARSWS